MAKELKKFKFNVTIDVKEAKSSEDALTKTIGYLKTKSNIKLLDYGGLKTDQIKISFVEVTDKDCPDLPKDFINTEVNEDDDKLSSFKFNLTINIKARTSRDAIMRILNHVKTTPDKDLINFDGLTNDQIEINFVKVVDEEEFMNKPEDEEIGE